MKTQHKVHRVVACADGYDDNALGLALGYAKAIISNNRQSDAEVILLTHTKGQLHSTSLSAQLGSQLSKAFDKRQKVNLPFDATLRHETLQTIGFGGRNAIVIAFYANDKMLDVVDGLRGIAGVVVVPDLDDSADTWITRWNPIVHGKAAEPPKPTISDQTIINGLNTITLLSNTSHDTLHPRDKESANEILRILVAKGHNLVPSGIKSWLVCNGWRPKAADEVAKLADRIMALKTKPSLGKFHDPNGRYERWKNPNTTD